MYDETSATIDYEFEIGSRLDTIREKTSELHLVMEIITALKKQRKQAQHDKKKK